MLGHYESVTKTGSIVLLDLSCTGAKFRGKQLPQDGEDIILKVEGLQAFGTVAWCNGAQCGIRFDLRLDPQEVEAIRKKVPRGMSPELRAAQDDWTLGVAR